jgi:hypothetical protein
LPGQSEGDPYEIHWRGQTINDLTVAGAFDGKTYWLASDNNGPAPRDHRTSRILATRVDPVSGKSLDLQVNREIIDGIVLSAGDGWAMHPALAANDQCKVLAVWADDRAAGDSRLRARLLWSR